MITRMDWNDLRDAGLLLIVNQILHIFGWAIVISIDEDTGKAVEAYPARVKFRGFDNKSTEEAYIKVSEYMNKNAADLLAEAKDGA